MMKHDARVFDILFLLLVVLFVPRGGSIELVNWRPINIFFYQCMIISLSDLFESKDFFAFCTC